MVISLLCLPRRLVNKSDYFYKPIHENPFNVIQISVLLRLNDVQTYLHVFNTNFFKKKYYHFPDLLNQSCHVVYLYEQRSTSNGQTNMTTTHKLDSVLECVVVTLMLNRPLPCFLFTFLRPYSVSHFSVSFLILKNFHIPDSYKGKKPFSPRCQKSLLGDLRYICL